MSRGRVFVLSGVSGAGKTMIAEALLGDPSLGLERPVTATDRSPRPGELNGVHYHFLSTEEFRAKIEAGAFFEHANVYGDLKGVPRSSVQSVVDAGRNALLILDLQGLEFLKANAGDLEVFTIFLAPDDLAVLGDRLRARNGEGESEIQRRLGEAKAEIEAAAESDHVDYLVENRDGLLQECVEEVRGILRHHTAPKPALAP